MMHAIFNWPKLIFMIIIITHVSGNPLELHLVNSVILLLFCVVNGTETKTIQLGCAMAENTYPKVNYV